MTAAYSPTPWTYDVSPELRAVLSDNNVLRDADGNWIAEAFGMALQQEGVTEEQVAANRLLLKGAPELLEALERIVELHYRDDYLGMAKDIQRQALAAIAAARGEELPV